jgi:uncharacterized protein (TIGR02118 family)
VIKTLSLLKRRPDLDRAAFRHHYETTHAPLALPLMTGLVRYVRYHIEEDLRGAVGFDVLSAFWYRDAEAVAAMMERLGGEEGKAILADELEFMDKPGNTFFPVSERTLCAGEEGDSHVFVLVAKPESLSRYDCSARLAGEHFPKLLAGFDGVDFALLRDAFPQAGRPLPFNAVLQVRAAKASGLERWANSLEEQGFGVVAVRTRRFETDLATS